VAVAFLQGRASLCILTLPLPLITSPLHLPILPHNSIPVGGDRCSIPTPLGAEA
jgi:hypothetical protein